MTTVPLRHGLDKSSVFAPIPDYAPWRALERKIPSSGNRLTDFASLEDERPREFRARFSRRARGVVARHRAKHRGRRLVALAVAIAVPAFASPGDWSLLQGETTAQAAPEMGFETPGESFPGSAFYYLADDSQARPQPNDPLTPGAHWDSENAEARSQKAIVGPAALPLVARGSMTDQGRALHCLTQAIYYEAASESDAGQRAVAQVVLNRVAHPAYPNTVCGVVYQGSARSTGCQFTFTCDGALARQPSRFAWDRARAVAQAALSGSVYAPIGLATHYHTIAVHPYWADSLTQVGVIGAHIFYRIGGPAGQPGAFRNVYFGNEPSTAALSRPSANEPAPDVIALAHEGMAAVQPAAAQSAAVQAIMPDYSETVKARGGDALYAGSNLPGAGSVKPEYARSGEWIVKP
jgi:spore germination cell wall hydrolase CwlJ-like protein